VLFRSLGFLRDGESQKAQGGATAVANYRVTDLSIEEMRAEGVPAAVLDRLNAKGDNGKLLIKDKKFATDAEGTGEQKAMAALSTLLGPQQAEQYREPILRHAYIYRVSPLWLIFSYMVISLGELMLSPMGLSLVSKVAPIRMRGLLMGGWFVATAIGNKLTAIGVYWSYWKHSSFFIVLGSMAFIMGVVLMFLLRPLKKAMPGV